MEHIIDATGKTLGRTATQAASILMGKNSALFRKEKNPAVKVKLINASKAKIDEKKMKTVTHKRYSGYPGGLTEETLEHVAKRKGYSEIFRHAVQGMLPANKLRAKMMKNITITE